MHADKEQNDISPKAKTNKEILMILVEMYYQILATFTHVK